MANNGAWADTARRVRTGMKYDPKIHHRRSIRLREYDYSSPGSYYVTICTHNKEHSFGRVVNGQMHRTACGDVAHEEWFRTAEVRQDVQLDAFVVMPNHIHGIIIRTRPGWNWDGDTARRAPTWERFGKPVPDSLPTLMRSYKSAVTGRVNKLRRPASASVWQGGYYEHVIRNETELNLIREYILTNPLRWGSDRYNPERVPAEKGDDDFDW